MNNPISPEDRKKIVDACKSGDVETLRAFYNAGVPINIATDDFFPLAVAVGSQQLEAARFLLDCVAPVNWRRSTGCCTTPLMEAAQSWPQKRPRSSSGDIAMVKLLLDYGANPLLRWNGTARTNCFNREICRLLEAAEIRAGGPRPIIEKRATNNQHAK